MSSKPAGLFRPLNVVFLGLILISTQAQAFHPIEAFGNGGGGTSYSDLQMQIDDSNAQALPTLNEAKIELQNEKIKSTLEKIARNESVEKEELFETIRLIKEQVENLKMQSAAKFNEGMDTMEPVMYAEAPVATYLAISGSVGLIQALKAGSTARTPVVAVVKVALGFVGLVHSYIEFSSRAKVTDEMEDLNSRADELLRNLEVIRSQVEQN